MRLVSLYILYLPVDKITESLAERSLAHSRFISSGIHSVDPTILYCRLTQPIYGYSLLFQASKSPSHSQYQAPSVARSLTFRGLNFKTIPTGTHGGNEPSKEAEGTYLERMTKPLLLCDVIFFSFHEETANLLVKQDVTSNPTCKVSVMVTSTGLKAFREHRRRTNHRN